MSQSTKLIGLFLLLHDIADLGRFDRPHHWMLGAFLLAFG